MIRSIAQMPGRAVAILVATLVSVFVLFGAGPVAAHSDLESSSPADGEIVSEPVAEIEVVFTSAVEAAGAGFEVLDPQGEIRDPVVELVDDRTFLLRLDPPLADGTVGVRYTVTAADGHVMTGGFAFEVDAAIPTTTTTTTAATTTTPAATTTIAPETTAVTAEAETTAPPATTTTALATTTSAAAATTTTVAEADAPAGDEPDRIEPAVIGALALAVAGGVGGGRAVRRNGSRPT